MKLPRQLSVTSLALAILSISSASAVDADDASADRVLRQMSAKLAAARAFTFQAQRTMPVPAFDGSGMPKSARIEVAVRRPDRIVITSTSKGDVRHFYADGRTLTVCDATNNTYAVVPMRTSIDGLVDRIAIKYGFIPPLVEFAITDVYGDIRHKSQSIASLGRKYLPAGFLGLGGIECDRVALTGKVAQAELWVGVNDQLPRKLIVTFKDRSGQLRIVTNFTHWNLEANPQAAEFRFAPPKDAMKIPMLTTAEIPAPKRAAPRGE
ncbi:MAG: DUF2092 domain-containing protein [Chthoniobacteraceae bacterium]